VAKLPKIRANPSKIGVTFGSLRLNRITFGGLVWPVKISVTFAGNDLAAKNSFRFGGHFHRNHQKFHSCRKLFELSFSGLCVTAENITSLFSTGFS
jgi:hypothetical protein